MEKNIICFYRGAEFRNIENLIEEYNSLIKENLPKTGIYYDGEPNITLAAIFDEIISKSDYYNMNLEIPSYDAKSRHTETIHFEHYYLIGNKLLTLDEIFENEKDEEKLDDIFQEAINVYIF